jgi:hypothetical protein
MTLAASGIISIGGSTATRSINLELGRSATTTSNMGETDLRTLAGVSSGVISMSNFYGKSDNLWAVGIVADTVVSGYVTYHGYGPGPTAHGSTTDTSCNLYSNTPTWYLRSTFTGPAGFYVNDTVGTPTGNAGWTTCKVYTGTSASGTLIYTQARTSASYVSPSSGVRIWTFGDDLDLPTEGNRYLVFT